jgi:thioredoxin 1
MAIEATSETFEQEVLNSDLPVLVDFWAPWCGPCKALAPTFEAVSADYAGKVKFVKVNVDETDLASKYGVRGIPALLAFRGGRVQASKSGAVSKAVLTQLVDAQLL